MTENHRKAMFRAEQLLPALPADFEVVVAGQRPRTLDRGGEQVHAEDATLLARRQPRS
ncbi:hypothetical protein ACF08M_13115 [Streptomyces sp. NPDC015032]|uniref:hypothetical protein n=1 Tax=Streptomyces sp. NPDC015032 TaxID=3364937 RepID=UPI0036FF049B